MKKYQLVTKIGKFGAKRHKRNAAKWRDDYRRVDISRSAVNEQVLMVLKYLLNALNTVET